MKDCWEKRKEWRCCLWIYVAEISNKDFMLLRKNIKGCNSVGNTVYIQRVYKMLYCVLKRGRNIGRYRGEIWWYVSSLLSLIFILFWFLCFSSLARNWWSFPSWLLPLSLLLQISSTKISSSRDIRFLLCSFSYFFGMFVYLYLVFTKVMFFLLTLV